MSAHSKDHPDWNELRTALIGLGETSAGKSYYPELRRKNAELERFRVLLDAGNDAILLADATSGAIIDMNHAVTELAPEINEDTLSLASVFGPALSQVLLSLPVDERTTRTAEFSRSGEPSRILDISAHAVLFHEHPYVVVVGRDVTERERAKQALEQAKDGLEEEVSERTAQLTAAMEELQDANLAKSQFLASMSHELRTPLNSIIGFSGIMLQGLAGELSPEQGHQLTMISRSGKHLLGLINDLLDLSRIEAGEIALEFADCSLRTILQDALALIEPLAAEKNLTTSCEVMPPDLMIDTDCSRLNEVLINLIGNAVKFTDSGSVSLKGYQSGDALRIEVSDSGPGIAKEHREKIWEYYRQLGRPHPDRVEGTGLGLAISSRLTRALGGVIELETEVGVGSTFTIVLPLVRPESA